MRSISMAVRVISTVYRCVEGLCGSRGVRAVHVQLRRARQRQLPPDLVPELPVQPLPPHRPCL